MQRYVTSTMPRDGIFRDAVPSRNVAIRQPSLKIGLNFVAAGVLADVAIPTCDQPSSRSQEQNAFFAQPARTTTNTSANNSLVSLKRPVLGCDRYPLRPAMEPRAAARQRPRWPGRQGEEIAEVVLRGMRLKDFILNDVRECFSNRCG